MAKLQIVDTGSLCQFLYWCKNRQYFNHKNKISNIFDIACGFYEKEG